MNRRGETTRRNFVKGAGLGLLAPSAGLSQIAAAQAVRPRPKSERLPREVWVGSVSLERLKVDTPRQMLSRVLSRIEPIADFEPDIVCLPEVFPFMNVSKRPAMPECLKISAETVVGPVGAYARANKCYVVCPVYTEERGRYYNSAVIIDRAGKVQAEYRKRHPTTGEMEKGVMPGPLDVPIFDADFGRIGVQICFDVNWPAGWKQLGKKGAEIVFWPSAFAGGRMLNARACMNKYHVVTSTRQDPTRIIDVTGEEIAATGRFGSWVCAPINLDKAVVHYWPNNKNIEALQAKYGRRLRVRILHDEGWGIIESRHPDIRIEQMLKEFDIPTHRQHIAKGHTMQEKLRK